MKNNSVMQFLRIILVIGWIVSENQEGLAKSVFIVTRIQTHKEIHVKQFGARPNDNQDDSHAIQMAIDYAVKSKIGAVILFDAGIYDLMNGIVLANRQTDGQLQFIDISLLGQSPAFSSNPDFGSNTVFRSHTSGFTIAIQKGRSCSIENIAFTGSGPQLQSAKDIMEATDDIWSVHGTNRLNRYSPHCAIAIDPFIQQVTLPDEYPGFSKYYQNTSTGGTSMLNIRGCSFTGYYIALAVNPSDGIQNGDNIIAESCHVASCHTFWSTGQTQSRNNHIRDVYALYLHTFISGVEIGKKQGTPPFVNGVNIAGFCKYVFNVQTLFSGLWIQQSYMENIWSLGYALVNTVSFDQCQIQFRLPDKDIFAPPFQLYSHAPVQFNNCGIEYFNNCQTPAPIVLRAGSLRISGGWIEGGVITPNGITNAGGDEAHDVVFENVFLKCIGKIAGKARYEQPIENLSQELFVGGTQLESLDGSSFISTGSTYHFIELDSVDILVDNSTKTASFITQQAGLIKENDNLFLAYTIIPDIERYIDYSIRPALGFVKNKHQQQIEVDNIPLGVVSGRYKVCILDYPIFIPPLWGVIQAGSNQINQVQAFAASFYPKSGTRISNSGFPEGAYVVSSDPISCSIQMSVPARTSSMSQLIKGKDYDQTVVLDQWTPDQVPVIKEGANIWLRTPFQSGFHFVNTSKAIMHTTFKPTLAPNN